MRYTHIVFDVDGTMIDTEGSELRALQQTLREKLGQERPLEELRPVFGTTGRIGLARLGYTEAEIDAVYPRWYDLSVATIGDNPFFPGVPEALQALREAGASLGVVTSRDRVSLDAGLKPEGRDAWFGVTICAEDTDRHKPDPAPLQAYLERAGASADQTLYVGDSPYDMACAAACGVDSALALWGAQDRTLEATWRPETPADLVRLCMEGRL